MLRFKVWGLLGGVALSCFGGRAQAACTMDNDCPGDLVCQDQVCVAAQAAAPAATPAPATAPAAAPAVTPAAAPAASTAPVAVVPPTPPPEPGYERRSPPMVVGGAVMIPVGALVLAIAVLLGPRSDCKTDEFGAISREELERCTDKTPKYVLGVGGGLLVVGGIALVSVGAQRVPKKAAHAGVSPWLSREAAGLNLRLEL